MKRSVAITGSSGLVGSELVRYFSRNGYHVIGLQRTLPRQTEEDVSYRSFELENFTEQCFDGADVIIHAAYRPVVHRVHRRRGPHVDSLAAQRIAEIARRRSIPVIFLSSLSACPDAQSYYAQQKFIAEKVFDRAKDSIVRLGIVIGGTQGLFGRMRDQIQRFWIIPLIDGGRLRLQTIALQDIGPCCEYLVRTHTSGVFDMAHPRVRTLRDVARAIAASMNVRRIYLSVPWWILYWPLVVIEALGWRLPFTAQNVIGVRDIRTSDAIDKPVFFDVPLHDVIEDVTIIHAHQ